MDALAFAECFDDPGRVLAWILSKCDRSRSYRRACEIDEWDAEIRLSDIEVNEYPVRVRYVLSD